MLTDLNIVFPKGELSLVCGKLGSGKTLLLLGTYCLVMFIIARSNWRTALLGEADFLTGQVLCPKTPPDTIASFAGIVPPPDKWVIDGVCAYVPQVSLSYLLKRWCLHLSLSERMVTKCFDQRYDPNLDLSRMPTVCVA
jgi:hypothetical protein